MKILLINVNCKHGSTGKIVYDLYENLNDAGHSAAVCYGRGKKIEEKNIYKFGINLETIFHAFMTRLTGLTGCYSYFSTRKLIMHIRDFKPDVVHIHELHAYFVNFKPLLDFLKTEQIKTVWTFHCEFMYTGKCGYAYECENWKNECGNCLHKKEYPSSLFFDFTKKMFLEKKKMFEGYNNLTIVTPSIWLAERVKESFLKFKKITVIHNGIDTNIFYPREVNSLRTKLEIPGETKIILSVAPAIMSKRKGGKYIIQLAEAMKEKNVVFILIGTEKTKRISSNIYLIKRISDQNVLAEYYSLADVFLICSERENFPTTCLEAQCCGKEIVGFDVGGTKETALTEGSRFVSFGDINELKKLLEDFLAKTPSSNVAKISNEKYSKEVMYLNYKEIYESIL